MKIGVMVESFRAGLEGGLAGAKKVGAQGVQIYATKGETHPDAMTASDRARLRRRVGDMGLEFSAICGDFGGHGFQVARDNPKRVEDSKKVMDLALDLGCGVVTTHVGVIPSDRAHPRYGVMARACEQLGGYAAEAGATFAIETGPEPAGVLRRFLDDLALDEGIGVNFDPANLAMVIAEDIPQATRTLGKYIVTHAKDGLNLKKVNAEALYGAFAGDARSGYDYREYIREVPLGQGAVPFPEYLRALKEVGFDGYLTVEREVGEDPRHDIELAVKFLKALLA